MIIGLFFMIENKGIGRKVTLDGQMIAVK